MKQSAILDRGRAVSFFLRQKQMNPLPDSLSSANAVLFTVFSEAAFSFSVNPYGIIDTFGVINLWTPCPGAQFITHFL